MSIATYIKNFFERVESTPIPKPTADELIDGKAFAIKHYLLDNGPFYATANDTLITANICEGRNTLFSVKEKINQTMIINSVSIVRFNDALGYKNAVGAIFGER